MLTALESPLFVLRLAWLLYSKHIALVHCHVFSAGLWGRLAAPLARLLGVPARVIFTEHNWYKKSTSRKRYWLNRLLAPLADKVVGVSPEVGRAIKDMYHLPEQQVRVIENGVALPHPNTKKPDMPYDLLGDVCRPCVISVCRLVADKRLDIWLRAFALLPGHLQAVAWIVGDGPERLRLEALARDLQIDDKIRFLGLRYDIPALLSHATVFLNTSDREGLPISVLEAAAAGVPIVASAVGGTPKIVQNGHTGLLISPGSPESAAKAVQSLLEEPQLAHQLATEARKLVYQKYSLEDNANNWMLLYDDILLENCGIAPSGV
jgi:glycosyltransferase involved in cell wall biosynthesis